MKRMTTSAANGEFGRYLKAAQREPILLTERNQPVAVAVPVLEWAELTRRQIEDGIARGLDDARNGRIEEVSEGATTARIARF